MVVWWSIRKTQMSIQKISEVAVGDEVRFKTSSPHDNVLWSGKVIGICSYAITKKLL